MQPTDPRDARIAALEKQIAMLKEAGDFIAAVASGDQKRCDELSIENATLETELAPFRAAAEKYKDACAHLKEAQCCDPALDGLIRAALVENEALRAELAQAKQERAELLHYIRTDLKVDIASIEDAVDESMGGREWDGLPATIRIIAKERDEAKWDLEAARAHLRVAYLESGPCDHEEECWHQYVRNFTTIHDAAREKGGGA